MNNNFNNWKKVNNITKKISMAKKKRWMLGFLLTTIFLAFLIPGGYLLSKQIADTFSIKNIRNATGKNTGDENQDGNKDGGNGNDDGNDDSSNDNLKPPTEVTRELTLNGEFVPIETSNIQIESFRIKELKYLINNDLERFFKSDKFFKSKFITYKYSYLIDIDDNEVNLRFIQQDVDEKKILLEGLSITDGMEYYSTKIIFKLKIINTNLFYQRYLKEYNFQSVRVDDNNIEMGYLPIKWLYLNQPPTGALLYKRVNDALDKFFKDHRHEFNESFIEPELRSAKIENEFDEQENRKSLIANSDDEIDINEFYLYFKAKQNTDIESFGLLNKVNGNDIKSFYIVTKLPGLYTTLNFASETLGLNFEISEINLSHLNTSNNKVIKSEVNNRIFMKVKELENDPKIKLVDDINVLNMTKDHNDYKISVNNDKPIFEEGIYQYDIKFISLLYPKIIINVNGYLKVS